MVNFYIRKIFIKVNMNANKKIIFMNNLFFEALILKNFKSIMKKKIHKEMKINLIIILKIYS